MVWKHHNTSSGSDRRKNLTCTIKSITLELAEDLPGLRVNGFKLENKIQMETVDGVDYFPFEPAESLIPYYLYTYYEWDQENQALTLYRDQKSYRFEAERRCTGKWKNNLLVERYI